MPDTGLDQHAKQFVEGAPVDLRKGALSLARHQVQPVYARFWFMSRVSPYRAWVIGWESRGSDPNVFLVDISRITLAHTPQDAPAMPGWTRYGKGLLRWMVTDQRGVIWENPRLTEQAILTAR